MTTRRFQPVGNYEWLPPKLPQGMLVAYEIPHAIDPETTGCQQGMVLSGDHFNLNSGFGVYVCPIEERAFPPMPAVEIPEELSVGGVLQPSLTSLVGCEFSRLEPLLEDGQPIIAPHETVRTCINRLIATIAPTSEKMFRTDRDVPCQYGELRVYELYPRPTEDRVNQVSAICLTPPDILKAAQTGQFLILNTNLRRYNPRFYTLIKASNFDVGFVAASTLTSIAPRKRLSRNNFFSSKVARAKQEVLEEIAVKVLGIMDWDTHRENISNFPGEVGVLPHGFHHN